MAFSRRGAREQINVWPGWVDALSSLIMVVVFVLLIFVVAQTFLQNQLSGRDQALARLNEQIASLFAELLNLRQANTQLSGSLATTQGELAARTAERESLTQQLSIATAERDALRVTADEQTRQAQAAQDQVIQLNAQIALLNEQLARLNAALEASEKKAADQQVQIVNLSQRLNEALASKVEQLARYRSEFFGRLREVLGNRQDIRVVGDRFVFQSEVLFETARAEIGTPGQEQLLQVANALLEIASTIPPEIDWVLRIDGHTDKRPIATAEFRSNWELSTARAISVVRFLIANGVPANRLAAAGFGEYQPIDNGQDEAALARNRRIELKLDQR
jgi:chemotaxis protein MotB